MLSPYLGDKLHFNLVYLTIYDRLFALDYSLEFTV